VRRGGRTDRRANMKAVTVAFRNFVNARKKRVANVIVCTKSALPFSYMLPLRSLAATFCSRISLSICAFVHVLDASPRPFHALNPQLPFAILSYTCLSAAPNLHLAI
jgi:hypothetical protein